MATRNKAIIAALVLGAGGAVAYGLWGNRPVAEVYVAGRGTAISAVYGTVKVVASMTIPVRARNGGVIQFAEPLASGKITVGSDVARGQELAHLVSEDLDREIAKAETDLKAAEDRQRLGPPSAPQLNTQEAQLKRLEKLAEMQNVPPSEIDRLRNDVQSLRERVRSEQLELDRQVTIFREQAGVLQDRKARSQMLSPLDGLLTAIGVANGEFVSEGSTPFTVATKSTYLEGQINEEDVGQVAANMKAAVRLYSFANQELAASVTQVLPTANNQRYTLTLTLDNPPANLMAGMTGEMNIIAGKRENALIVPSRALLANRVFIVKNGMIKPRAVKVGFRNLERVEILEGLKDGDQVVVADQDLFKPGQRVRAVTINM